MAEPKEEAKSVGTVSAARMAELVDYTDRHLRRIAKEGFFPHPIDGEYKLLPTLLGLIKYQKTLSQKTSGRLFDEKLAKEIADRKMAEVMLAKATNSMVPLERVDRAWSSVILAVRARLLQMPEKFGLAWSTWQSSRDCKAGTEAEIRDALTELATNPDYFKDTVESEITQDEHTEA
jgi:hypothetical protein